MEFINPESKYKKICVAANKLLNSLDEFTHPGLSSEQLATAISEDYNRLVQLLDESGELWKED